MNHKELYDISLVTLSELITPEGIFASSSKGRHGVYHGLFGRDTLITASLVVDAELSMESKFFTENAIKSVLRLATWQGTKNDTNTGEQLGKIPHEIRTNPVDYLHLTEGAIKNGDRPWYVDPTDKIMKNWDSADSTPMWVWAIGNFYRSGLIDEADMPWGRIKAGLDFCMHNLEQFGGLAGYGFDLKRTWGGLYHQTWKDSSGAYLSEMTGKGLEPPVFDVWVNGCYWAALRMGEVLYKDKNPEYSLILGTKASELKQKFNSSTEGFLLRSNMLEHDEVYFGECLNKDKILQRAICVDPALCLWSQVDGECIIEDEYVPSVIRRIMADDMFNPNAGVRIYASSNSHFDPLCYHRGPHTYWPFVSGVVASALLKHGNHAQAGKIFDAMLTGVSHFGSCIELYLGSGDSLVQYQDPYSGNFGCTDQAWTAAALYAAFSLHMTKDEQILREQVEV